jgi:glycosyltransferase involved in cell wall biosynthesis
MPTYNRAGLLPETISSILSQDYCDLELLIVDDGSVDDTGQVVNNLMAYDARLRYHRLDANRGIGFARQAGLEWVSGQYIALADSDDLWMPGKLKMQVDILDAHPDIDILFGDFWNINHLTGTEASGFEETRRGLGHLSTRQIGPDLWLVEDGLAAGILDLNFIAAPTMLIRASILEKIGGFDPSLMAVDHEFGFRASALGAHFAYINCPLIYRHVYSSSNSQRPIKSYLEVLDALDVCLPVCVVSQRTDLIEHIDNASYRTYIHLMYSYGQAGQRAGAWDSYRKALTYKFHAKDLALLLVCLGGARVVSWFEGARKVKNKWFKRSQ